MPHTFGSYASRIGKTQSMSLLDFLTFKPSYILYQSQCFSTASHVTKKHRLFLKRECFCKRCMVYTRWHIDFLRYLLSKYRVSFLNQCFWHHFAVLRSMAIFNGQAFLFFFFDWKQKSCITRNNYKIEKYIKNDWLRKP